MIERYSPPAIRAVWSDQHRLELWLRIEVLACEAWATLGRIPASALPKIRQGTFDVEKIAEVEARVGHDVIAFLTVLNESIGQPEARYVHLGMTSQDLNDTATAVQLVESARLIGKDLASVRDAAADLAIRHRRTLMAGRTHGVVAEPITFGFKVAGWVAELDRAQERLVRAADEVAVGRVSGAVGTHATVDPKVEEHVCKELGLRPDDVSTQVVARDRHASFMSALEPGRLVVVHGGKEELYAVGGGFLQVDKDKVIVLADTAEARDDIDVASAQREFTEATERLRVLTEQDQNYKNEAARVRRATARLNVAGR